MRFCLTRLSLIVMVLVSPALAQVTIHQGKGESKEGTIHTQIGEVGIVDTTGDGEGDTEAFSQNRVGRTQNNHITLGIAKFDLRRDQPHTPAALEALRSAKKIELVFDIASSVGKGDAEIGLYLLDDPTEDKISPKPIDFHRPATLVPESRRKLSGIRDNASLRFDVTEQVKKQVQHGGLRTIGFRLAPTDAEALRKDAKGGLNVQLKDPRLETDAKLEAVDDAAAAQEQKKAEQEATAERRRQALAARSEVPLRGGWVFPEGSVVNVTLPPYNADNTGKTDASAAIQRALDDHRLGIVDRRILYLPDGTYRLSRGLVLKSHALDADRHQGHGVSIIGQSRGGVVLQLDDHAEGFDNIEEPRPVLSTTSGTWTNIAFMISVMNMTIDTGKNNPGAIGLRYIANNQGAARNLTIRSGDPDGAGWAGIDMDRASIAGPAIVKNVEIVGFDHGVRVRLPHYGMVLEHVTLRNQRVAGIRSHEHALTIRKLISHNRVPAVQNVHADGMVVLLDSTLTGGAADAVAVDNAGHLFARNVETSGYRAALRHEGQDVEGKRIDEFASAVRTLANDGPKRSINLPVEETPEVVWDDPSTWVNVADFGAKSNDWDDDAPAIQRAIDSMQGDQRTLYFPPGRWMIDQPIVLRGNLRRVCGMWASLATKEAVERGTDPVFRIDDMPETLFIDMVNIIPQPRRRKAAMFEHAGSQDVVFQHVYIGHGPAYRGTGTGRVFMEDVCALAHEYYDKSTPEPYPEASPQFDFGQQTVWARQFDPEQKGVMVHNGGGDVWILGIKTEQAATVFHATGGRTEILGGTVMPVREVATDVPAFLVEGSARVGISVAQHVGVVWKQGKQSVNGSYGRFVREMTASGAQTLSADDLPDRQGGRSFSIPLYLSSEAAKSASADR